MHATVGARVRPSSVPYSAASDRPVVPSFVAPDAMVSDHRRKDASQEPLGQKVPRPGGTHTAIMLRLRYLLDRLRGRDVHHLFARVSISLPRRIFRCLVC